jgi:adenine-specific DNA glycosylase
MAGHLHNAGLWEFPGVMLPAEASEKDRRKQMDALLLKVLGDSFSSGEVLHRQSLGSIVHIFSHIRMTLHVEKFVLKVRCLMFIWRYTVTSLLWWSFKAVRSVHWGYTEPEHMCAIR